MPNDISMTRFALERDYETAEKCLEDALLVAREREYHGVAYLIGAALGKLVSIGQLTGINRKGGVS